MAFSFRRRLAKRNAQSDLKSTAVDHEEPSGSTMSSNENVKPKLTQSQKQEEQQTNVQDDHSSTPPPPERKLRSPSETTSRNISPSHSLLDKYKYRTAKASISTATASPVKSAKYKETYKVGKDTAFSENFEEENSTHSPEWVDVPDTPESKIVKETRVYDGVEFEMMGKKGKAGEAPLTSGSEEPFNYERRSTRSQTRRQQRADSHDSTTNMKESAKNAHLLPPSLSIGKAGARELPRTPSPQTGTPTGGQSAGQMGATPANSPRDLPSPPRSSPIRLVDRAKNMTPLSRVQTSPDPITGLPAFNLIHKRKTSDPKPTQIGDSSTLVIPPPFDPNIANGYQWTSPLASSSRPSEPWGWLKVWTCCQCGHLDRNGPAQTMVEQKVCSRLACGHERCSFGCKVTRDQRFAVSGPFQA